MFMLQELQHVESKQMC